MFLVLLMTFYCRFWCERKRYDAKLDKIISTCRQANLKLNKDKCLFRCTSIPFFGEIISQKGVSSDSRKIQALTDILPPKPMKELQSFLGILQYVFFSDSWSMSTLWKLTSVKTDWAWNGKCLDLYDRGKKIIKKDACIKFYETSRTLSLEMEPSGAGLGAGLLQLRDGMDCGHDYVPGNATLHLSVFCQQKSIKC